MEYKEANKRIITDLKYQATRAYERRGPKQSIDIFVGYNKLMRRYLVAVSHGPDSPTAIRLMGMAGLDTREQLIDCALEILDQVNGNLIVYAEPGYEKPHDSTI